MLRMFRKKKPVDSEEKRFMFQGELSKMVSIREYFPFQHEQQCIFVGSNASALRELFKVSSQSAPQNAYALRYMIEGKVDIKLNSCLTSEIEYKKNYDTEEDNRLTIFKHKDRFERVEFGSNSAHSSRFTEEDINFNSNLVTHLFFVPSNNDECSSLENEWLEKFKNIHVLKCYSLVFPELEQDKSVWSAPLGRYMVAGRSPSFLMEENFDASKVYEHLIKGLSKIHLEYKLAIAKDILDKHVLEAVQEFRRNLDQQATEYFSQFKDKDKGKDKTHRQHR